MVVMKCIDNYSKDIIINVYVNVEKNVMVILYFFQLCNIFVFIYQYINSYIGFKILRILFVVKNVIVVMEIFNKIQSNNLKNIFIIIINIKLNIDNVCINVEIYGFKNEDYWVFNINFRLKLLLYLVCFR